MNKRNERQNKRRMKRVGIAVAIIIALIGASCIYVDQSFDNLTNDISHLQDLTVWEGADLIHQEPVKPAANPYLADSGNSIGHTNPAQQDTFYVSGPEDVSRHLDDDEIIYQQLGPGHFGALYSSEYPDGSKVMWSNGFDKIVKLDHETFEIIDSAYYEGKKIYSADEIQEAIDGFNTKTGLAAVTHGIKASNMFKDLSGIYTLLDSDNNYYMGGQRQITVYGDSVAGDPDSDIEIKGVFELPVEIEGVLVGMNMTYDGWLTLATEEGYLIVLSRDLTEYSYIRLPGAESAKKHTSIGFGWVRNGMAVDEDNGIYIASNETMHKIIWTGEALSVDPEDGAWHEPYSNSKGTGTGATPTLMGFGDEDQFVVITDGDKRMNLVTFWRNDIPEDWQQIDGTPSRRIAGSLPVTMGPLELDAIQSEQSVVVSGYGALVVNNEVNRQWWVGDRITKMVQAFYSGREEFQPYGMFKAVWDPEERAFKKTWVNIDVSSPNGVPAVSQGSDMVYTIGSRDGQWTLEALDWTTGESSFHYVIGDETYNSCYSAALLDENGHIHFGTTFGKVKIVPEEQ